MVTRVTGDSWWFVGTLRDGNWNGRRERPSCLGVGSLMNKQKSLESRETSNTLPLNSVLRLSKSSSKVETERSRGVFWTSYHWGLFLSRLFQYLMTEISQRLNSRPELLFTTVVKYLLSEFSVSSDRGPTDIREGRFGDFKSCHLRGYDTTDRRVWDRTVPRRRVPEPDAVPQRYSLSPCRESGRSQCPLHPRVLPRL